MREKKEIFVYAHWVGIETPLLMGKLSAIPSKGKEVFSFEYSDKWLKSEFTFMLDPELQNYSGQFFPSNEKQNFGVFLDSCPDRWGRVLMNRREAALARKEDRKAKNLLESDYLLGVYDGQRMGGLRFKLSEDGNFLNDDSIMAVPPWVRLRALENAARKFEEDEMDDPEYLKWITLLIAPGSSLGGARPKAGVRDEKGHLWIAKFPSLNDDKDVGAWEMVASELAAMVKISLPTNKVTRFTSKYHTFLTKRFDRNQSERIHFASAMTLLGFTDGAGSDTGASYLDLVTFISKHGANVNADLEELWKRIVFNIRIKNTDDHLRNHGFLLTGHGWKLSPAYDMNPNEFGTGLSLNISETDNSLEIDLAMSVHEYFRIEKKKAEKISEQIKSSVQNWKKIAKKIGISNSEQERMRGAFE